MNNLIIAKQNCVKSYKLRAHPRYNSGFAYIRFINLKHIKIRLPKQQYLLLGDLKFK